MTDLTLLPITSLTLLNPLLAVRDMLSHDFMRYAFEAGTMLAIVAGLVGYFVVLRHLVFAVEALAHVTFTGALLAAILGINPMLGLFGVTILVALGMGVFENSVQARSHDVETGIILAWLLGLGVLCLSIYTSRASAANSTIGVNFLFGSILGLEEQQAQLVAAIAAGTIVAILAIARPLLFASLDPDVATAHGVPVRGLNLVFLVLAAISVSLAVPAVGALLNFALVVTPAAIAQLLVIRPFVALLLSAALALIFTWVGLTVSFYTPYPVSFLISTLAFLTYVLVVTWQRLRALKDLT